MKIWIISTSQGIRWQRSRFIETRRLTFLSLEGGWTNVIGQGYKRKQNVYLSEDIGKPKYLTIKKTHAKNNEHTALNLR